MRGIAASDGIGIGKTLVIKKISVSIENKSVENVEKELDDFNDAVKKTEEQISKLRDKAPKQIGQKEADVFDAHLMILQDPEWMDQIVDMIKNDKVNSEYAVKSVTDTFEVLFSEIEDPYIKERVADLKDISMRLIRNIQGVQEFDFSEIEEDTILVGHDFNPSDTVGFTNPYIKGFVTEIGSAASHTAIIAKTIGIPAVLGIRNITNIINSNVRVAVNGGTGEVIIEPSADELSVLINLINEQNQEKEQNKLLINEPSVTLDGKKIEIAGNIGKPTDASLVMENGGDGVGLFRSEFIFMDRDKAPTENEQFEAYKLALSTMEGRPVIIRTLDAGGDKHVPYLNIAEEMNPFLGYRAIRICLKDENLFLTQLRAILRASVYGNAKIMFPMISNLDEVRRAKAFLELAKAELTNKGIPFDKNIKVGIMVEVPSAAIMADVLAKEVDFMSIGTNDLTQYVLAADRMNESLADLYSNYDPAVLRLIYNTISSCKKENIMACMCGEAAGDQLLIPLFLAMGLDEFSMSPSKILKARKLIRSMDSGNLNNLLEEVLALSAKEDIKSRLEEFKGGK